MWQLFLSDLVFTTVFALELVLRGIGLGVSVWWSTWEDGVDVFVVVGSCLAIVYPRLSTVRALRVLRPMKVDFVCECA